MAPNTEVRAHRRRWWACAVTAAFASLEGVAAFGGVGAVSSVPGIQPVARTVLATHARGTLAPCRGQRKVSGLALMCGRGAWDDASERDQAMGFLSAEAVTDASALSPAQTSQMRAELLARQAKEAMEAAREAEERAKAVKEKLGPAAPSAGAGVAGGNGLSAMLSPMAVKMANSQGEYLRTCPVRQMQEDLREIRCGVMNIVGALGPQNLLALGAVLYVISVIQISQ